MSDLDPYSRALVEAVAIAVPGWVERSVALIAAARFGAVPEPLATEARAAGAQARVEVVGELTILLHADLDAQRTTPLAVLRAAVRFPTAVLAAAGVPPVRRDEFAERAFPADVYGLSPATWADVAPELHEPGLVWGAWKAQQHLARHRPRAGGEVTT